MAYKVLFFLSWGEIMKDIGNKLKEARESIGVSIEEAAEDLKMRPSQIENIEEGNMEAFQDIFYLKYFIRDYSKYLGLNKEEMVDEFNEYLFDYTSKISIDDIKNAKKKMTEKPKDKKKIVSPYTIERRKKVSIPPFVIYIAIFILLISIIYFAITLSGKKDDFNEEVITVEK